MTWLVLLSVPLGITGVFLLFRFWFPNNSQSGEHPLDAADSKRFRRVHLLSSLSLPVLIAFILYPLSVLLPRIRPGLGAGPDLLFAGAPGSGQWTLAALPLAMGLAILILDRAEAFLLGKDLLRLRAFQSGAYGFDAAKVRSFFRTVTLVAGVSAVALMLDYQFQLRRDRVVMDAFLSISTEEFPVKEVAAVLTAPALVAPDGKTVPDREYVVMMSDGRKFNSLYLPGVTPVNRDSLFTLIALLSGKGLTEKAVLDRQDLR